MTDDCRPPRRRRAQSAAPIASAARVVGRLGGPLVRSLLVVVALFWLLPAFGLLVASLRPEAANAADGWWTVLRPAPAS